MLLVITLSLCLLGASASPAREGNCAIKYREVQRMIDSGVQDLFPPNCDAYGRYDPVQCMYWPQDVCWCVDTTTGESLYDFSFNRGVSNPICHRPPTDCEQAGYDKMDPGRGMMPGQYIPQCQPTGEYSIKQCHSSTGFCWCVNENGQEIFGTRTRTRGEVPNCDRTPSRCELERYMVEPDASFVPVCQDNGQYERRQCFMADGTEHCRCVSPDSGEEESLTGC